MNRSACVASGSGGWRRWPRTMPPCSCSAIERVSRVPLDDSLRSTVVELCRLLDRLPLAIELAAARCDVLAPAEILARLGRQPTLLRSDDPTISARQRSLDDTISWSHELLSTDEQLAFRRLGVFAAGFGLEAPTAAVADDDIDPYDVPELVWSLVSKSLVASEPAAGSTRYRMLDTVRAFAQRRLDRSGELAPVAVRLGRFYVDSYGPQLEKADAQLLAERAREIDNIRALIPTVAPHDEELAQHLACTVVVSHRRDSPRTGGDEGLRLLDQLTARTPTRVALLVEVVVLTVDQGLIDVAAELLDEAELLAADVGSPRRGSTVGSTSSAASSRFIEATSTTHVRSPTPPSLARRARPAGPACSTCCAWRPARRAATTKPARRHWDHSRSPRYSATSKPAPWTSGTSPRSRLLAGNPHAAARRQLECLDLALELGSLREVISAWVIAARLAAMSDDWDDRDTPAERLRHDHGADRAVVVPDGPRRVRRAPRRGPHAHRVLAVRRRARDRAGRSPSPTPPTRHGASSRRSPEPARGQRSDRPARPQRAALERDERHLEEYIKLI